MSYAFTNIMSEKLVGVGREAVAWAYNSPLSFVCAVPTPRLQVTGNSRKSKKCNLSNVLALSPFLSILDPAAHSFSRPPTQAKSDEAVTLVAHISPARAARAIAIPSISTCPSTINKHNRFRPVHHRGARVSGLDFKRKIENAIRDNDLFELLYWITGKVFNSNNLGKVFVFRTRSK